MTSNTQFSRALNAALEERRLSSTELRRRLERAGLRVSAGALSYWRSGQRRPEGDSLHTVAEIEWILDLPDGTLTGLVGRARRIGPQVRAAFDDLTDRPGQLGSLTRLATPDQFDVVGQWTLLELGPDGFTCRLSERRLWRARTDGAHLARIVLHMENTPPTTPEVEAVGGCSVGEIELDPATGFLAAELFLSRPLEAGETAMSEHAFVGAIDTRPFDNLHAVVETRAADAAVWVRFHPDLRPGDPVSFETVDGVHEERPTRLVGSGVHHVVHRFGPGVFGVRWAWETPPGPGSG